MVHGNFPKLIDGWPFPKMGNQPTWPWQCLDPRTPQALWRSETGSRRMAKSTVTGGIHTGRFVFLSWNMNTININIEKKIYIYSIYIKYDIELHLLCLWSEYSMPFTYNYGVLWQSVANMLEPQRVLRQPRWVQTRQNQTPKWPNVYINKRVQVYSIETIYIYIYITVTVYVYMYVNTYKCWIIHVQDYHETSTIWWPFKTLSFWRLQKTLQLHAISMSRWRNCLHKISVSPSFGGTSPQKKTVYKRLTFKDVILKYTKY